MPRLTVDEIRQAPKVLLHDHLDGGLRPATIIELAEAEGYDALPTKDPGELSEWMTRGANRADLVLYLETFVHTVGVMQSRDSLIRVARECAEDLAADGVVYAEVRFAPELHIEKGLSLDEVVEAVLEGFRQGSAGQPDHRPRAVHRDAHGRALAPDRRARGPLARRRRVRIRHRRCGGGLSADPAPRRVPVRDARELPHHHPRGRGVRRCRRSGRRCSSAGPNDSVTACASSTTSSPTSDGGVPKLGRLASYVRDLRVPLEMCPSSNVHSGAARSIEEHPIGLLSDLRFRVTVNTDNRLMSHITMSEEFAKLVDAFGWGWNEIRWATINGMKSAFMPFDQRLHLINEVIKPWYADNTFA